jgi:hypothetical protein
MVTLTHANPASQLATSETLDNWMTYTSNLAKGVTSFAHTTTAKYLILSTYLKHVVRL